MPIPIPSPTMSATVADAVTIADLGPRIPADVPNFRDIEALLSANDLRPGVVLVGPHVPRLHASQLADRLDARSGRWIVVALERPSPEHDLVGRSLSLGLRQEVSELLAGVDPSTEGVLLDLETVLHHVARARHDINNPLTTILAETQLLLLDAEDAALRESLETIERQARRIRDLVARLAVLRPPPA